MQAQLSVATQPPNSAFHPLHLSCTGTCNSVSTVFWSIFGTIRSIFSGRSAARRGVFRPPGRILAQKFVFCYRTTDFVNGPFVAIDDIFDLAPSDRFLNFLNQESYRVPKKSGPRKKGFWPFSLAGWFYMDRNNAVWSGHIVAPLWIPHLPIFGKKIDPRPPQWPVCNPLRDGRFGTFGSIFKLFVSELRPFSWGGPSDPAKIQKNPKISKKSKNSKNKRGYIAPIDQRRPGKTKETVWEVRLRQPKFV